jgi:HupH hydrogenase expression protein, C-terminal conserved region
MSTTHSFTTQFNIQNNDELTWNVTPLLHEIKHALQHLIDNKKTTIIDLRSIPLAPGEEERILNFLGQGEVQAELNSLGTSKLIETQFPGVWIVTHYNDDDEIIGRFIEITTMPDILLSQKEDIVDSSKRLSSALDNIQTTNQ